MPKQIRSCPRRVRSTAISVPCLAQRISRTPLSQTQSSSTLTNLVILGPLPLEGYQLQANAPAEGDAAVKISACLKSVGYNGSGYPPPIVIKILHSFACHLMEYGLGPQYLFKREGSVPIKPGFTFENKSNPPPGQRRV